MGELFVDGGQTIFSFGRANAMIERSRDGIPQPPLACLESFKDSQDASHRSVGSPKLKPRRQTVESQDGKLRKRLPLLSSMIAHDQSLGVVKLARH